MGESDDIDWSELADEYKKNHRPHAGHFSWESDRALAEIGVTNEFAAELERTGRIFFSKVQHRGEGRDPPDCEALDAHGSRIAIEVTELVDAKAAAAAREGFPYEHRLWSDDLAQHIQGLIDRKDKLALRDPPYAQYVLLIFSDERGLNAELAQKVSVKQKFEATQISRVFLLLSYEPRTQNYPCFELQTQLKR